MVSQLVVNWRWLALSGIVAAAMTSQAQADLIGRWTFDEASSGTGTGIALDSSGYGDNGTIYGGATYTVGHGGTGGRLTFDGTNDYVDTGINAALGLVNTSYTISWWSSVTSLTSATERIINRDNGNDSLGGYSMYFPSSSSELKAGHNWSGNNYAWSTGKYINGLGVWQNWAVVFDLTNTNRKLYLNGSLVATVTTIHPLTDRGTDPLWFGAIPSYGQYFKGSLDDIQIYNQALTAQQIGIVYGGGAIVPEPSTLALLGIGMLSLLAYAWRRQK